MRPTFALVLALLSLAEPTICRAETLETAPADNGSGGVFLDLLPFSTPMNLNGFDVPLAPAIGTPVSVEIWTRTGSYVGFTDSSTGWTFIQTIVGLAQGTTTPVPLVLDTPILLPTESTTGIYLHAVLPAASGSGIRYTGTGGNPPQTLWSNSEIGLFSDVARTGFVSFGGTMFSPRTFSGIVRYSPADRLFADGFDN